MNEQRKLRSIEYGFLENEAISYFTVRVSKTNKTVTFIENIIEDDKIKSIDKAKLTIKQWMSIRQCVEEDFSVSMKEERMNQGKWIANGDTRMHRLLGKELLVLVWGIENLDFKTDSEKILIAQQNWRVLPREKRWWIYNMIDFQAGKLEEKDDQQGWRYAVKFMLTGRPPFTKKVVEKEERNND